MDFKKLGAGFYTFQTKDGYKYIRKDNGWEVTESNGSRITWSPTFAEVKEKAIAMFGGK